MENNLIKKFVKGLKTHLKPVCKDERLIYTCFNRFLAEKYIEFHKLKGIENFLRSNFKDIFNENTDIIISELKDFSVDKNIFEKIQIFDLCFQYYNFDKEGFYRKTQFYTPQKLVERICDNILSKEAKTVLEPSCGSGVFLREIFNRAKKLAVSFEIKAFELDMRAIQLSQISFTLNAYEKYGEKISLKIENKDFIFEDLKNKFDCILGNPPFLGRKLMPQKYRDYLKSDFNIGSENLAYGFLLKSLNLLNKDGKLGFIIPDNFIYLENTKEMKNFLETNYEIEFSKTEKGLFEDIYGSKFSPLTVYVKGKISKKNEIKKKKVLTLGDIASVVTGIQTGNNKKYIRHFKDIPINEQAKNISQKGKKWYPYLKGGGYKKWSGNDDFFVFYENNGEKLRKEKNSIIRNEKFFNQEGITYSYYCENRFSARYKDKGAIFDIGGSCLFFDNEDDLYYTLALLNSSAGFELLTKMNPTMSFQTSTIKNLPLIIKNKKEVIKLSKKAVEISKKADKFLNTSKHFKFPDFINKSEHSFEQNFLQSENKFLKLKSDLSLIEKQLNEIFEEIYFVHPEKIYSPKPLSIKKIRKQMIKDFFEWGNFKTFSDVKNYFEKNYPLSANKDMLFVAKILNGKTFNDTKKTIEKAL